MVLKLTVKNKHISRLSPSRASFKFKTNKSQIQHVGDVSEI